MGTNIMLLLPPAILEAKYALHTLISPHPGLRDQGLPPATACKYRRSPHPQPRAEVSTSFPMTSTERITRGIALLCGPCRKPCSDYSGRDGRKLDSSTVRYLLYLCSRGNTPKAGFDTTTAGRTPHIRDAACPGVLAEKELDT